MLRSCTAMVTYACAVAGPSPGQTGGREKRLGHEWADRRHARVQDADTNLSLPPHEDITMKAREMEAPQQARPRAFEPKPQPATVANEPASQARHVHRERDYGIGYGNSSGYASLRHFTDGHVDPLFHLG